MFKRSVITGATALAVSISLALPVYAQDTINEKEKSNTKINETELTPYTTRQTVNNGETKEFENALLKDLKSEFGGALYLYEGGKVNKIENSIFKNNGVEGSRREQMQTGGAILNSRNAVIQNITNTEFTGNFAGETVTISGGGAIYNEGVIYNIIDSKFSGNYAHLSNSLSLSGAILNQGAIENIIGTTFENNYAESILGGAQAGAIQNQFIIKNILDSRFIKNHVYTETQKMVSTGGALTNLSAIISNIKNTEFIENSTEINTQMPTSTTRAYGGAIFNSGSRIDTGTGESQKYIAEISNMENVSFKNNSSKATKGFAGGGAIYNTTDGNLVYMNNIQFEGNHATTIDGMSSGGAIQNTGEIKNGKNIVFNNNYAKSENGEAKGGAIYNSRTITLTNVTFKNNYAKSQNGEAKGGAIFLSPEEKDLTAQSSAYYSDTPGVITIVADNGTSEFTGNYTESNGIKDNNAIYGSKDSVVNFEAKNSGKIILNDNIKGETGYKVNVSGDSNSNVYLNNNLSNAELTLFGTNLDIKKDSYIKGNAINLNSGNLNLINKEATPIDIQSLTVSKNTNIKVDVDLKNETMDRFVSKDYGTHKGNLVVNGINILSDTTKDNVDIYFAEIGLKENVEAGIENLPDKKSQIGYSPIYKYTIGYNSREDGGYFTFSKGAKVGEAAYKAFNPAIFASPVAAIAGAYTTQLGIFDYAFRHSDSYMMLSKKQKVAGLFSNKTAADGNFSPLFTNLNEQGYWIRPYTSFESIKLDDGPKVSNISYGTLVGYDSDIKNLGKGFKGVLTGYMGYNGVSQRYSGVDTYLNGGTLGVTGTLYKGKFFNAATISVGAMGGASSTMYGDDEYGMLMTGIADKIGYNFEFKDGRVIFQPNLLLSYSFINTFDYTNAAGIKINSDPMNAIQIAPGFKFILNTKNGYQPYLTAKMVWNIMDRQKVTADDTILPELGLDPYVQYGAGIQKLFNEDKMTAFGQVLVNNGGRNGVMLNLGLRFLLGKDKK